MYALAPDVILTEAEHGVVLLNERTGSYWLVNDTGAALLRSIADTGTIDQAVTELCDTYRDTAPERIEQDSRALIAHLQAAGLVTS
jgi:hypothetical protein